MTIRIRRTGLLSDAIGIVRMADWSIVRNKRRWMHGKVSCYCGVARKGKDNKKFLGKNYEVVASNGHVRDLPKSQMGIDIENDFEPKYITIRGKGDILAKLRKEAKKQIKFISQLTPTARERRFHGI